MNVDVSLDGDISVRSEIYTRWTGHNIMNEARLPISYGEAYIIFKSRIYGYCIYAQYIIRSWRLVRKINECKQVMKKFLKIKTGSLTLPQKGQKQGVNLGSNALTSLVHFAVQLHKVD